MEQIEVRPHIIALSESVLTSTSTKLQTQFRIEHPLIAEDSVAQKSQEMHAKYADKFSIATEDIPPLLRRHITAVGLDIVLPLLEFIEKKGGGYADLCQVLRNYIACNLTEKECVKYLK